MSRDPRLPDLFAEASERQGEARSLAGNPALPGSFKIFSA